MASRVANVSASKYAILLADCLSCSVRRTCPPRPQVASSTNSRAEERSASPPLIHPHDGEQT